MSTSLIMKKPNFDIQALTKKLFHQQQGTRRIKLMHPKRDWVLGLSFGLVLFVGIISWNISVYFEQRQGVQFTDTDVVAELPTYRAESVSQALDIYKIRQENFAALSGSRLPIIIEEPTAPPPGVSLPSIETASTGPESEAPDSGAAADVPPAQDAVDVESQDDSDIDIPSEPPTSTQ